MNTNTMTKEQTKEIISAFTTQTEIYVESTQEVDVGDPVGNERW